MIALGVLPASTSDAVVEELRFISKHPDLVGVISGPHILGLPFDHPDLVPFWCELEALSLPIFVHPRDGVANEGLKGYRHKKMV